MSVPVKKPRWDRLPPGNAGFYVLVVRLAGETTARIGALGRRTLSSGLWAYVGRARRNLRQRLARYIRGPAATHWHIDHLLSAGSIAGIYALAEQRECELAAELAAARGSQIIRGFGSSDCRCAGHLVKLPHKVAEPTELGGSLARLAKIL